MAINTEEVLVHHVAKLGAWIIGSIEDGPDEYSEHVTDLYEIVAELRSAR